MILVDANVLVYAVDADSAHHRAARAWLERTLSGSGAVGLPWIVLLAFLRVTTRARVMRRPLVVADAIAYVDEWISHPLVSIVAPGPDHWRILRALLRSAGTGGNLSTDAHLAAMALERGAEVCSFDHDFRRFPGIELVSPLD